MNDFLTLAKERYSVRSFRETPLTKEQIDKIVEAGRVAPSACNNQPEKIYVVESEKARKALSQVTPCTFNAPVVFVIGFDKTRSAKGLIYDGYDFGTTDAAIVTTHMMLEAAALGLGSCWVGRFNESEVRAALNLSENVCIRNLLPTGYPAEGSAPSARHAQIRPAEETVCYL